MQKRLKTLARQLIYKPMIATRLPISTRVTVGGRDILFHDIAASQITEDIVVKGFDEYEYELSRFIRLYDLPVGAFIDAGANIGYYSVLADLHFGANTKTIAIEAFPNNVGYLQKLKSNNGLNFEIIPYALAEATGLEKIFYVPTTHRSARFAASGSLINSFQGTGGKFENTACEKITVKTISLGDVISGTDGRILMKIDIEGYEFTALKTIESVLRARDDFDLVVEIMINDEDKNDLFAFLASCGYDGYLITNAGLVYEDRPLTLPYHNSRGAKLRTCWKNHFFTKRPRADIEEFCRKNYGYIL